MSNCPNKKHPDWITTVNKVGIVNAYRLFVNNNYVIPKIGPFKTVSDVENHLSGFNKLQKRNNKYYIKYISPKVFEENLKVVTKEVDRINTMYNGQLLIIDAHSIQDSKTGRKSAYFVAIDEDALNDFWKGFKRDDKESNIIINEEGDVLPFDDSMYQQREGWSDDREELKDFRRKVEYLKTVFPDYEVVEDINLTIPGQIDKDGRTIRMNPNLITKDSIGHEFGHIIIDSIGGINNSLVRRARNLLIGSKIEAQVLNNYPNLLKDDPEKLDKEIVAQAIGKESIDIFDKEIDISDWRRWLQRFFDRVRQLIGIEENAVVELSKKLVNYNWNKKDKTAQEELNQEYQKSIDSSKISPYERLRQEALDTLYRKKIIRTRHGRDSKTAKLEQLIKKIEALDKDPLQALKLFQDFAEEQTNHIYLEYLEASRKKAQGSNGFTLKKLNSWNNYISGFDTISEYTTIIEEAAFDKENPEEAKRIKDTLDINKLREIRDRQSVIKNAYVEEGKNLVAKFLSRYSNHVSAKYKESFERDYNKLSKEEKSKISREDYINEKLGLNADKINQLTENSIKIELAKAGEDITVMQRWVENLLDSPDPVVSSMVNAMTETMRNSRLERISLRDNMVEILRDLEKLQSSEKGLFKSYREFYDFMLEKDKDGNLNGNIVDVFKSDLWKDYARYRSLLEKKRLTYRSLQKKLWEWRNKNAPMSESNKKKFRKDRLDFIEKMHNNKEINNEELTIIKESFKNPFLFELHEKINNEAATKFANWIRSNSWSYRTPIKKYKSDEWDNLVEIAGGNPEKMKIEDQISLVRSNDSDPRLRFFNFIKDNLENIQKDLPYIHRIHDRLPGKVRRGGELFREGDIKRGISRLAKEQFTVLSDETGRGEVSKELTTERGEPLLFLPVYYTNSLDPETEQSYDLADAYLGYFSSAIDFKHKNEVLPEMEMARFLVNNREVLRRDSRNKKIIDRLRGRELTKSGVSSMVAAQLNDWFDSIIFGVKEKEEGTIGKTRIDKGKFADWLNKYTSLNLLGFNVVQGTANVILGSTIQWIEAFGGENYSSKDYLKAKIFYSRNLGGILNDIGSRKPTNIVTLLNREFDTLNEYTGGNIRRDSKFSQLMSTNTLFFTSHAGEHWMQSKVMLAMLNNLKAKDKSGNVIGTMLSKISVENGKLKVDKDVANFGDNEKRIFEGKMKRVLSSLHGEYSEMGRVALQRVALGRMAYMFRKFVFTGFRRRWGKKRINNITGQYQEGNYLTFGRFFSTLIKDMRHFQLSILSEDWRSLTNNEKSNVKRTFGEVAFLLATILLIKVGLEGDDDEESNEDLMSFLAYQAYRFRAEVSFFINPTETLKILRSPMASMSLIENSIKFAGQLADPIFSGDLTFDRYERGNWKGDPKIKKTIINFIPAYKQIYRLKYVDDQIGWLR